MFPLMTRSPSGLRLPSTARPLSLLVAFLFVCATGAQTAERRFDVLRTLDGQAFTNAVVSSSTPAYLVVLYDGGGRKIYFTNLADNLRADYGYDPAQAEAYESKDAEKKKQIRDALDKQAAAAFKAENTVGEAQKVQVLRVLGGYKYHIRSEEGEADVVFLAMPSSVSEFLNQAAAVDAEENAASASAAAAKAPGKAPKPSRRMANYTASAGAQATAISAQQAQARSARAADDAARKAAQDLAAQRIEKTTILAGPTGRQLFGLRVWQFIGFPPKSTPAKAEGQNKKAT